MYAAVCLRTVDEPFDIRKVCGGAELVQQDEPCRDELLGIEHFRGIYEVFAARGKVFELPGGEQTVDGFIRVAFTHRKKQRCLRGQLFPRKADIPLLSFASQKCIKYPRIDPIGR